MSTDYTQMWESLGLDLEAHDQLLAVLGQAYGDIFLSQRERPAGMGYFDFVMSEVHGLRIRELLDAKAAGRTLVGTYCVFVPEEIVLAAGGVCVGLCSGADFATEEVEKYLPRNTCALIKSSLGFKLGRVCPYLESVDMVVGENTCDGKKKAYETLGELTGKVYVMDMPQMKTDGGRALLRSEYRRFAEEMERRSGRAITAESLREGIRIANAKREAMRRLSLLRAARPAPISGLDALLVSQVSFYDDPARFTASVNALCDELEARVAAGEGVAPADAPRVLMSGCPMAVPNWKLPWIVESAGAVIVGEESCVGERGLRNLVADEEAGVDALLDALVDRYFQIDCAIFTPNPERTEHVASMSRDYGADGVIHYGLNFFTPYLMESIPLARAMEERGLPTLRVETDYSAEDVGQLKTRVEAFLELLN